MPRARPLIAAFNAGEWSPRMQQRADLQKYDAAARTLQNALPLAQGPATRRPGARYVANTKADAAAELIPFVFSTVQAYMLAFSDLTVRFFRNRGVVESSPGTPYEVTTPYTAAQLGAIRWCQSADVLYLAHPDHQPRKLTRTGHTAWTLTALAAKDGPYLDVNATTTTLTPSATSGSVTLTASAAGGINGGAGFEAGDVGRAVRLLHSGTWGWGRITDVGSATSATVQVERAFGGTGATADWRIGAWGGRQGWPRVCVFHEERLAFASTPAQPQTAWLSALDDFELFAPTTATGAVEDANAITLTIADDQVNAIRWISPASVPLIGTVGGEFVLQASSLNEALTPANATARRQSTEGVADVPALRIGAATLAPQRAGRSLLEWSYSVQTEGQVAVDLSLLADHLTLPGIRRLAWQRAPWRVVWAAMLDGTLAALTYQRDQDVVAWSRHPLGGGAKVLSVASIPGAQSDELWLVTERTIGGVTRRFVEHLEDEYRPAAGTADARDAFFVDAGLTYSGAPADTISGLGHLEGAQVAILADGSTHPPRTVTGGSITLDVEAATVHVGFGSTARVETLDLEAGSAEGTARGSRQRANAATVYFVDTVGGRIGVTGGTLDPLFNYLPGLPANAPPPLFTGAVERTNLPTAFDRPNGIVYENADPLPFTLAAVAPRVTTNG